MKIRTMAAVFAAKSAGFICRKMGRQGVTWAGKIALKINPDILEDLSSQVRKKIFVTCGTNGKTTTNNMLCAALENEGQKVVCNHTGSNMLNGVVAAFVLAAGPTGRLDADYACIEVDEAFTRHVFPGLKPDYMLLTNLFRDQLDRYGEIDITMNILEEMIRTVPKMQVMRFRRILLWTAAIRISHTESVSLSRRVRQTRYGKDVFVKSVVPGWNTVFTTIVSWVITSAHPVALQDRKSNMMPMM